MVLNPWYTPVPSFAGSGSTRLFPGCRKGTVAHSTTELSTSPSPRFRGSQPYDRVEFRNRKKPDHVLCFAGALVTKDVVAGTLLFPLIYILSRRGEGPHLSGDEKAARMTEEVGCALQQWGLQKGLLVAVAVWQEKLSTRISVL